MRTKGEFIRALNRLDPNFPIHIIHGVFDPHPFEGVYEPIHEKGLNVTLHLLEKCGHTPWKEQFAKEEFFSIVKRLVTAGSNKKQV